MTKIFVIDDCASVMDWLVLVLRTGGFDAVGELTAPAAIETAKLYSPDILLCDVQLGSVNGVELSEQILKVRPECRVIILTGEPFSTEMLAQARAHGCNFEVVTKPIPPKELLALLGAVPSPGERYHQVSR